MNSDPPLTLRQIILDEIAALDAIAGTASPARPRESTRRRAWEKARLLRRILRKAEAKANGAH